MPNADSLAFHTQLQKNNTKNKKKAKLQQINANVGARTGAFRTRSAHAKVYVHPERQRNAVRIILRRSPRKALHKSEIDTYFGIFSVLFAKETATAASNTLPQKGQVYLACCWSSTFFITLRRDAP